MGILCKVLTLGTAPIYFAPNLFQRPLMNLLYQGLQMQRWDSGIAFVVVKCYFGKQCTKLKLVCLHHYFNPQVRLFNLSRVIGDAVEPSGVFRCHSRRVKKLAVRFHLDTLIISRIKWKGLTFKDWLHSYTFTH